MRKITVIFIIFYSIQISAQEFQTINLQDLNIKKPRFGWESNKIEFQPALDFTEFHQFSNPLENDIEFKSPEIYPEMTLSFASQPNYFSTKHNFFGNAQTDYRLNKNSWLNLSNYHASYWGLGAVNTVSGIYHHKLTDNLVVSAGLSVGKSALFDSYGNNFGVNGNLKYLLSDHVNLNFFGGYSLSNIQTLSNSLTHQGVSLGGSVEIKISEKFSIIVGVTYQYDSVAQKWVAVPFIMPHLNVSLADLLGLNKKKNERVLLQRNALEAYKME